jgi:aminoglycoside phosphotransferase family enzyme/predicted kinase
MRTGSGVLNGLLKRLCEAAAYPHPVEKIEFVETHISWVFLTGRFAYKIKKPVCFSFLDFSTLEKRKFFCQEELRLNRRWAAGWYKKVVPIMGPEKDARVGIEGGPGEPIEYAVQMLQFPSSMQLDRLLEAGNLDSMSMDALGRDLAIVHRTLEPILQNRTCGTPEAVLRPAAANFHEIEAALGIGSVCEIEEIEAWTRFEGQRLSSWFSSRRSAGFVRECHGDLHLSNLFREPSPDGAGRILAFDCIEFNPALRSVDVISDLSFLVMDLLSRHRADLASRVLNSYLETSGDYPGVTGLRFYLVYRSMVRAKVAALQGDTAADSYRLHLDLALEIIRENSPRLIATCGLSGSGKTTVTTDLMQALPAIRLRSDVERRRLFPSESAEGIDRGRYSEAHGETVYRHLESLARTVLESGHTTIVDAAFLRHARRDRFRELARETGASFSLLWCRASEATLRSRVRRRAEQQTDASEADGEVLDHQVGTAELPRGAESADTIELNTDRPIDLEELVRRLSAVG